MPVSGVVKRIPATGRMAVDVSEMPVFDLTVIPFLWSADPNREVVETTEAMEADPEGHELLWDTRTLLPIGDLKVTAHEPVLSSSNNAYSLYEETQAIRAMESGRGHYMGMMSGPVTRASGLGRRPGRVSFSIPRASTMAHELGHNLSLQHAPCGNPSDVDQSFPYPDGSTGVWGYDFRNGGRLVHPSTPDLMSYCRPRRISDYHFANALRFRLFDEGPPQVAARSLLLWGGMDAEGEPFLNPTFVVDAPAALPDSTGSHRIIGRTASGGDLFSVDFTMPEGGRQRRKLVLRLRPPGSARLGRQPGDPHALRARRFGYAGRRYRSFHDDPARSEHRTGKGDPAGLAAGRRGRLSPLKRVSTVSMCSSAAGFPMPRPGVGETWRLGG